MASYPSATKSFPTHSASQTIASADINAIQDEVVAVETGIRDGFAHPIIPLTDDSYDLGSSSKQWQDLYLSGSLFIDGVGLGSGWTAYTPTWTAASVNPAIGNGTLNGRYLQIGKMVFVDIALTCGSSTTFGTGAYSFALPVTASDTVGQTMTAMLTDSGTAFYGGRALLATTATLQITTEGSPTAVGTAAPFTWAQNDAIKITGFYVAA